MGKYDPSIYLAQLELRDRGLYAGALDGDRGKLTDGAIAAFAASKEGQEAAGLLPQLTTLAERIINAAKSQLGVRETSNNRGPGIEKYWDATDYPTGDDNREPWCAAFVCWCIMTGVSGLKINWPKPRTARAFGFEEWGRANASNGLLVFGPGHATLKPRAGDVFTLPASHVGIVTRVEGGYIYTVEGNTNDDGAREGYEVAERKRAISSVQKFIRIPA